mgnify:CR=1 FL=1
MTGLGPCACPSLRPVRPCPTSPPGRCWRTRPIPWAHGAFRNNKELHDKCIAVRKLLLADEARYRVNLKDAEDADPAFAEKLRESGVNNSPSQMSKHLGRLSPLPSDDGTPLPTPPAPAGGIAFDDIRAPAPRASKGWRAALAIGGGTAVAGAAYYWVRGRHRDAR